MKKEGKKGEKRRKEEEEEEEEMKVSETKEVGVRVPGMETM